MEIWFDWFNGGLLSILTFVEKPGIKGHTSFAITEVKIFIKGENKYQLLSISIQKQVYTGNIFNSVIIKIVCPISYNGQDGFAGI